MLPVDSPGRSDSTDHLGKLRISNSSEISSSAAIPCGAHAPETADRGRCRAGHTLDRRAVPSSLEGIASDVPPAARVKTMASRAFCSTSKRQPAAEANSRHRKAVSIRLSARGSAGLAGRLEAGRVCGAAALARRPSTSEIAELSKRKQDMALWLSAVSGRSIGQPLGGRCRRAQVAGAPASDSGVFLWYVEEDHSHRDREERGQTKGAPPRRLGW